MWWYEGHQKTPPLPPSCLLLSVPIIWMGTHGCVPQWQVPETHPDYPNPSSHIHSRSDNSWCAGSLPASPFIRGGIRVSLFVLGKWGGRAGCPRLVYTAQRRDPKQGPCINTIQHFIKKKTLISHIVFLVVHGKIIMLWFLGVIWNLMCSIKLYHKTIYCLALWKKGVIGFIVPARQSKQCADILLKVLN